MKFDVFPALKKNIKRKKELKSFLLFSMFSNTYIQIKSATWLSLFYMNKRHIKVKSEQQFKNEKNTINNKFLSTVAIQRMVLREKADLSQ